MSKSSISILAKEIANSKGLTQVEAERFITQMFGVANDAIQEEKQLKMKWLGTFKVTAVKDRESVDVNTGERIVIEGRDKISFTPDNILKEIVNRPFAQFETVVVNDGVDFSDIDEKFAQIENDAVEDNLIDSEVVKAKSLNDSLLSKESLPYEDSLLSNENNSSEELVPSVGDDSLEDGSVRNVSETAEKKLLGDDSDASIDSSEENDAPSVSSDGNDASNVSSEENDASSVSSVENDASSVSSEENVIAEQILESVPESAIEHVVESASCSQEPEAKMQSNLVVEEEVEESEKIEVPEESADSNKASNPVIEASAEDIVGEDENEIVDEDDNEVDDEENVSRKHHLVIPKYMVVVACVVFLALSGAVCWFAYNYGMMQAQQKNLQVQLADLKADSQKKAAAQVTKQNKVAVDSAQLALREKARQDSLRMAAANEAIGMAERADSLRKVQEKQAAQKSSSTQDGKLIAKQADGQNDKLSGKKNVKPTAEPADENSSHVQINDVRVRTGAYRIVGVAQTVTVREGQTLQSISRRYLGPGMECYVEALNGCKAVNTGQKVKIPKLELKKKTK